MLSGKRVSLLFAATSASILLVKAIGFVRDILLGAKLGTTGLADIYAQIFGIPGLLFAAVGVAASSISIPFLVKYAVNVREESESGKSGKTGEAGKTRETGKAGDDADKAGKAGASGEALEARNSYVSALIQSMVLVTATISILIIVTAPAAARLLLPGTASAPALAEKAVILTRLMAPSLIFVCLAYITSGVLQVHGRFILTSVISIPFNFIIILTLISKGGDIVLLGAVTTAGWALQFLMLLPALRAEKYRLCRPVSLFGFADAGIRSLYRRLIPIMLGNAMLHICIITDRIFASGSEEGAAAALSYGSGLFMTVTGVFTIAMSTIAFPELSKYYAAGDGARAAGMLGYIFRTLVFIFVPYLIITVFFNTDLIGLIYERGRFDAVSTAMSSRAFLYYSFCIAGYVLQEVTGRIFCAIGKYRVPMLLCIIFISLNIAFDTILRGRLGIAGIAGTTAAAAMLYAVTAGMLIRKETGNPITDRKFWVYILRTAVPAAAMTVFFALYKVSGLGSGMQKGFFIIPVILGCLIYAGISWLTGAVREVRRGWIFS